MSSSCDRVFCTMLRTVVAVCLEMLLNVEKYGNSGAVRNGNGRAASHSIRKDFFLQSVYLSDREHFHISESGL